MAATRMKFSDKYLLKGVLGTGGFAVVKKCVEKSTGLEYAAKIINIKNMTLGDLLDVETEARICSKLQHPNIAQLIDNIKDGHLRYLVFELVTGGELFYDLASREFYNEAMASHYMQEILRGIQYCHEKDIVHRDLKPENLLLANKNQNAALKLADFGMAFELKGQKEGFFGMAGTPNYMAPEVLKMKPFGKPIDIWACGIILYLMLFGYPPFIDKDDDDNDKLFALIKKGTYEYPQDEEDTATPGAKNLIDSMLTSIPNKRITATEALKHPWIHHRERVASRLNRQNTINRLKRFNARRKFKAAILTTIIALRGSPRRSVVAMKDATTRSDTNDARKKEIIAVTKKLLDSITSGAFQNYTKLCEPQMTAFEPDAVGNLLHGVNPLKFRGDSISANNFTPVDAEILNPHVHLLGNDVACIAYVRLVRFKDKSGKVYTQRLDETRLWRRHNGKWRTVHFHSSAPVSLVERHPSLIVDRHQKY